MIKIIYKNNVGDSKIFDQIVQIFTEFRKIITNSFLIEKL